jgi:hypothetical protein
VSGRNGLESALRATPALNGFSGPLEFTDAHYSSQDDLAYFRAHPEARTRIRPTFPCEFPRVLRRQARARGRELVIIVAVERDAVGEPTTRARGIAFTDGGNA